MTDITTTTDERIARIEDAIGRLEALGLSAPVVSPSSVNPDGSPGHVAPGELIESAWGNAVSDEFNRIRAVFKQVSTGGVFSSPTPTDFPGLSISASVAAGRIYRVSAFVATCSMTASAGVSTLYIVNQAGQTINRGVHTNQGTEEFSLYSSVISSTASGAVSYKVMMSASVGSLTVTGNSTQQSYIIMEELSKTSGP